MDNDVLNSICITGTAATITSLLGVPAPRGAAEPIGQVLSAAQRAFGEPRADKVVMYNPDAVALWLFQRYTALFDGVVGNSQLWLPMLSVMPSVTPVCFASMYTGVMPDVHGIKKYTKPVLKTDTVFDALLRAGKKPVIVSTEGDSISMIFLEREMEYYIYKTEEECNEKALELIERGEHDLIVLYNGNYDAKMHKVSPEGDAAMQALRENVAVYEQLAEKIRKCNNGCNTALFFAPDHGCHEVDGGSGSHGLEMPEDMNITHFYSFIGSR